MRFLFTIVSLIMMASSAFAGSRACITKKPFDPIEVKTFLGGMNKFAQVKSADSLERTTAKSGFVQISAANDIVNSSFRMSYEDKDGNVKDGVTARVFDYNTDGCNVTFKIVNPANGKVYPGKIEAKGSDKLPRLAISISAGVFSLTVNMAPTPFTKAPAAKKAGADIILPEELIQYQESSVAI